MSKAEKLQPRTRLEDIEADLLAYRLGWMQYDGEHVRALQKERTEIIAKARGE